MNRNTLGRFWAQTVKHVQFRSWTHRRDHRALQLNRLSQCNHVPNRREFIGIQWHCIIDERSIGFYESSHQWNDRRYPSSVPLLSNGTSKNIPILALFTYRQPPNRSIKLCAEGSTSQHGKCHCKYSRLSGWFICRSQRCMRCENGGPPPSPRNECVSILVNQKYCRQRVCYAYPKHNDDQSASVSR